LWDSITIFMVQLRLKNAKVEEFLKTIDGFRHQVEELKWEGDEHEDDTTDDRLRKIIGNHSAPKSTGSPKRMIYPVNDLAEIFQVTPRTIYNWKAQGRIGFIQIKSKTYVTADQLEEFLKRNEVKSLNLK